MKTTITFRTDDATKDKLKRIAAREDRTLSAQVERIIKAFVKRK